MKKGHFSGAVHLFAGMCVTPAGVLKVKATDDRGDGMKAGSYKVVQLGGNVVASNPPSRVHTFVIGASSITSNTVTAQSPNNNVPNVQTSNNTNPNRANHCVALTKAYVKAE
jgi:hypothetical protein